mgnify:CR=1 FL=1
MARAALSGLYDQIGSPNAPLQTYRRIMGSSKDLYSRPLKALANNSWCQTLYGTYEACDHIKMIQTPLGPFQTAPRNTLNWP